MGVWGTNILQNDVASDVKDAYLDKRKRGTNRDQATEEILEEFSDYIEDCDDGPYVWITLALIQWEYSELDEELKNIALQVIENNNIVERWLDDNPAKAKKVESNLKDIREKLKSSMTYKKKILPYNFYHNDWNIGDVYYIELTNDLAKEYHLEGRYILTQKIDEEDSYPGHIVPVVRVRITKDNELPKTEEEFLSLEYVKDCDKEYLFSISTASKQSVNRYFKYLNRYKIQKPDDEANEVEPFGIIPKSFQRIVTNRYIEYNLKLYPTEEDNIKDTYELVQKMVSELPEDSFIKKWNLGDVYAWKIRNVKYISEQYREKYLLIQKVGYWVNKYKKIGILAIIKLSDENNIEAWDNSERASFYYYTKDMPFDIFVLTTGKDEKELSRLSLVGNYLIEDEDKKKLENQKFLYYTYNQDFNLDGQMGILGYFSRHYQLLQFSDDMNN